jgi:hypothetical protein
VVFVLCMRGRACVHDACLHVKRSSFAVMFCEALILVASCIRILAYSFVRTSLRLAMACPLRPDFVHEKKATDARLKRSFGRVVRMHALTVMLKQTLHLEYSKASEKALVMFKVRDPANLRDWHDLLTRPTQRVMKYQVGVCQESYMYACVYACLYVCMYGYIFVPSPDMAALRATSVKCRFIMHTWYGQDTHAQHECVCHHLLQIVHPACHKTQVLVIK